MSRKILGLLLVLIGGVLVSYKDKIYEGIVGKVSWQRIVDFPEGSYQAETAKSVAKVTILRKQDDVILYSRCTGFVVNSEYTNSTGQNSVIVMTNKHCVTEGFISSTFNFYNGSMATCNNEIAYSEELDFSLLECLNTEGAIPKELSISDKYRTTGTGAIISYNCDYYLNKGCKPFALIDEDSEGRAYEEKGDTITHYSDSLGGSSGSPYFNKGMIDDHGRLVVIGIHNAARMNGLDHPAGAKYNYAKSMRTIRPMIAKFLPKYKRVPVRDVPNPAVVKSNNWFLDLLDNFFKIINKLLGVQDAQS